MNTDLPHSIINQDKRTNVYKTNRNCVYLNVIWTSWLISTHAFTQMTCVIFLYSPSGNKSLDNQTRVKCHLVAGGGKRAMPKYANANERKLISYAGNANRDLIITDPRLNRSAIGNKEASFSFFPSSLSVWRLVWLPFWNGNVSPPELF